MKWCYQKRQNGQTRQKNGRYDVQTKQGDNEYEKHG